MKGVTPIMTVAFASALLAVSFVLYVVALRFLILLGGLTVLLNNFSSKFLKSFLPKSKSKKGKKKSANLLLENLSRIPSQPDLKRYKPLAPSTISRQMARRQRNDDNGEQFMN